MVEGNNTITLTVFDNAENSNSANCTVQLDTTAPTVEIGQLNTWYNTHFDIALTYSDAISGTDRFYIWANTTAIDTTVPGTTTSVAATTSPQDIASSAIDWTSLQQSNANYIHVKAVDKVGNVAYKHAQFGFDNVIAKPSITFTQTAYKTVSANVTITYDNQDVSGIVFMQVTGDISNGTATDSWEAIASSRSVTLTTGDGTKSVQVRVKDTAGNISDISDVATTELDTVTPAANLVLYERDGTTSKKAHSNVATFSAKIYPSGDDTETYLYYQLYGAYTPGKQESSGIEYDESKWVSYTPDSGKSFKMITDLYCTSGDGEKSISLKFKDNAGNISDAAVAKFVYDTTIPTVEVKDIDYNRISKIHNLRRNSNGEITGKYADETNFSLTPDTDIIAWKVCAYVDQTAAQKGSHNDTAIPSTNGSVNMSGTQSASTATINAKIKGADYELALGGTSKDGAHIVVVYVQDEAENWSAVASFDANFR